MGSILIGHGLYIVMNEILTESSIAIMKYDIITLGNP